jgi:hypothetical protein
MAGPRAGHDRKSEARPLELAPMGAAATAAADQKLKGASSTGVQRVFFTTDRNDWLDA